MKYRTLGNTDTIVSELGFGALNVSGWADYGYVEEAQGIAALKRAKELGVTFFDTAEGYADGKSEEAIGKAFGNDPDIVLCTKVGGRAGPITAERVRHAVEASLRRLCRDHVDIYLLHNPTIEQIRDPAIWEAMYALQQAELVKCVGVSVVSARQTEQCRVVIEETRYQGMELTMNMVEQEAEDETLPAAGGGGVGTIIRVPLGLGLLTGKYQPGTVFPEGDRRNVQNLTAEHARRQLQQLHGRLEALRELVRSEGVSMVHASLAWVLNHADVSTVIPGCKSVAQVEDNVAAVEVGLSAQFLEGVRKLR